MQTMDDSRKGIWPSARLVKNHVKTLKTSNDNGGAPAWFAHAHFYCFSFLGFLIKFIDIADNFFIHVLVISLPPGWGGVGITCQYLLFGDGSIWTKFGVVMSVTFSVGGLIYVSLRKIQ